MPPSYTVRAEVVDIFRDTPQGDDLFLVDTNVWYWTAYAKAAGGARQYQISSCPKYLQMAKTAGAVLTWCGLSLAELAHLIETTERKIYETAKGLTLQEKEYRHDYPGERANDVVPEVQAAWAVVENIGMSIDLLVNAPCTTQALYRFANQPLGGYDLFLLEAMARAKVTQILTDDGDFVTVPGIKVFTNNLNVIRAAKAQGRLVVR
jgi:predicted nucleic acid-binding protein